MGYGWKQRPSLLLKACEVLHPFASTFSGTDIIATATSPTSPIIAMTAKIASVVVLISIYIIICYFLLMCCPANI